MACLAYVVFAIYSTEPLREAVAKDMGYKPGKIDTTALMRREP